MGKLWGKNIRNSFLLAQTMRKKCESVVWFAACGAVRGVRPVISGPGMCASGYCGCVMQPTPSARLQGGSSACLMLTAAVMQAALQKGVFVLRPTG